MLTSKQLGVLRHALGVGNDGAGNAYRNHFCAGPGHDDYETCQSLVATGLMTRREGTQITGGDPVFYATDAGRQAAIAPPPALTRSQRRYRMFLNADSGLSFGEWLRARAETA